jgi:hypothetical protein
MKYWQNENNIWGYLPQIEEDRFRSLADYLGDKDLGFVVDFNCGYGPLRNFLTYQAYIGNDVIPQDWSGFYHKESSVFAETCPPMDCLIYVGMEGEDNNKHFNHLLRHKPKILILEAINDFSNLMGEVLTNGYIQVFESQVDLSHKKPEIGRVLRRTLKVFERDT